MKRAAAMLLMAALVIVLASWSAAGEFVQWAPARALDSAKLGRAGLRVVESSRCTMVTDLPASPAIDGLPAAIDAAGPQWAERFGTAERVARDWRLRLYLVRDRELFGAAGLMPAGGREFPQGLALGYEAWVIDQPSDYYRRCLTLHEGTHAFMQTTLGGCGPGWYMEATAELLGAHSGDAAAGTLRLGVLPKSSAAAPQWGRPKLLRAAAQRASLAPLDAVRKIDNRAPLGVESYARVWGLAHFLDNHPAYRERWRRLSADVLRDDFDGLFDERFAEDRKRLEQEWRRFSATIDYGHDVACEAIDFRDGAPLSASGSAVRIDSRRGWQPTGVRLAAGETVSIRTTGRFTIHTDADGNAWPCEAGGVTLRYHAGRPLGELHATIDAGPEAFVEGVPLGTRDRFTPTATGTLYLRLNDSPAERAENRGAVSVRIAASVGYPPRPSGGGARGGGEAGTKVAPSPGPSR
ncbi:MAG: hypothetical protein ACRCT8_04245 [Lacipirellulaceae bacterium]